MQWSFQPVGGWVLTGLVTAVLLALVATPPSPRPDGRRLWVLRGLRLLAVLMVLLAMARPTLIKTEQKQVEATLVLLLDESRSMRVEDSLADESRWTAMKRMLAASRAPLSRLAERWDVRLLGFAEGVTARPLVAGSVRLSGQPTGDSSAIGDALGEVLRQAGGERLLGVVLLSDGAQRALPPRETPPQAPARRLAAEGAPLYAVTFGTPGSGDRADLAIEDLAADGAAFVKAPTEVVGALRASGFAGRTFAVQLLWEDDDGQMAVVDSTPVAVAADGGSTPFVLRHTPLLPGERKLSVRVEPAEGELITGNNQQSTFITVREGGVKVLYLAGAGRVGGVPGLEQRFVRSSLAAAPDIAVERRVYDYRQLREAAPDSIAASPPADAPPALAPPDVVVLDDLDSSALSAGAWGRIADAVRDGMGLAMLGGRQSFGPGGFRGTPLAAVLPVGMGPAERQALGGPLRRDVHIPGPLRMRPTRPLGARHPILQLSADGAWPDLPPMDGANRFDRRLLKRNALVLAETDDDDAHPLLAVGQAGAGRVLASALDSTWRWRIEGQGEAHRRFWRQAVLWLAKKDDAADNPVWVKLDSRRVARGGRLDLRVGLRDVGSDVAGRVAVTATVQTPTGERLPLPLASLAPGETSPSTFAQTATPGDYTVRVTATAGAQTVGQAEARFSVPDEDLELDNPAAEPAQMALLAAATSAAGGRAVAPEELPKLLQEIADRPPDLRDEVLSRVTYWDTWPFFLLLVGLLSVEWYLRKRWGLV